MLNKSQMSGSVIDSMAEQYFDKYSAQISAYESHSLASKAGISMSNADVYSLGQQLQQYEEYQDFVEGSYGSLADLGTIPNIALDVITAAHGSSIIPLLASTQPLNEELGTIYFKQIKATDTYGDRTEGDIMASAGNGSTYSDTYGSSEVISESFATTVAGTTNYAGNLGASPSRPQTVKVTVDDGTVNYGVDDGNGVVLGLTY